MTKEEAVTDVETAVQRYTSAVADFERAKNEIAELYKLAIKLAIEAQEQLERGWIPCSEKLPEYYRDVLITTACDFDDIHKGWRSPKHEWFCDGAFVKDSEILAWMPRPKPYRPTPKGIRGYEKKAK